MAAAWSSCGTALCGAVGALGKNARPLKDIAKIFAYLPRLILFRADFALSPSSVVVFQTWTLRMTFVSE